jgi:hypothetical protein
MKSLFWRRWLRSVFGAKQARRSSGGAPRWRRILSLEAMEDRSLPSGSPVLGSV